MDFRPPSWPQRKSIGEVAHTNVDISRLRIQLRFKLVANFLDLHGRFFSNIFDLPTEGTNVRPVFLKARVHISAELVQ
ncbi:MAG: hypothetical protein JO189_31555 [Deltaproteobacteria bacterium]|nr:hypothetical protein [Deltaproteobacteria bacterium]